MRPRGSGDSAAADTTRGPTSQSPQEPAPARASLPPGFGGGDEEDGRSRTGWTAGGDGGADRGERRYDFSHRTAGGSGGHGARDSRDNNKDRERDKGGGGGGGEDGDVLGDAPTYASENEEDDRFPQETGL